MQTNTQDNDTSNVSEKSEQIREYGQIILKENNSQHHIFLLSIIGEIEGHEQSPGNVKTTKYEHVLPLLAMAEDNQEIDGILVLLNTMGGDVEAGLAIAEMIASISKPTVSLVLGGSHSIGVPLAVSAKYSFIVPSGTMVIHPVRMNGTVIAAPQTFRYFDRIQERIIRFVGKNSGIPEEKFKQLMLNTDELAADIGSILYGTQAVELGLIDRIGSLGDALDCLHRMIDEEKQKNA